MQWGEGEGTRSSGNGDATRGVQAPRSRPPPPPNHKRFIGGGHKGRGNPRMKEREPWPPRATSAPGDLVQYEARL